MPVSCTVSAMASNEPYEYATKRVVTAVSGRPRNWAEYEFVKVSQATVGRAAVATCAPRRPTFFGPVARGGRAPSSRRARSPGRLSKGDDDPPRPEPRGAA